MTESRSILLTSPLRDGFRIGDRTILPLLLRMEGPGFEERLEPQILGVLLLLAERAGEPVPKAEFFERIWEGRFVSEDVLHRAISRLRALLGDDARAPKQIETIPKVGYRLLVTPEPLRPPAASSESPPDEPAVRAPKPPDRQFVRGLRIGLLLVGAVALVGLLRPWRSDAPVQAANTMRPARPEPLVALPGVELQPALSPDGSEVAFSWDGEDGRRRLYRLGTAGGAGGAPRRITQGAGSDEHPIWSHDGRAIYFVRSTESTCRILRFGLDEGDEQELAECAPRGGGRAHLALAPDGETLYWSDLVERDGPRHAVRALDLADGATRWVTDPPAGMEDLFPAISPDGSKLAFARGLPGASAQLHELRLEGSKLRVRGDEACVFHGIHWVDDEEILVSRACAGHEAGLHRIGPDGSVTALEMGGDRRAPAIARDGSRIVFESWRERSNLVSVVLDGSSSNDDVRPLAPSSRLDHSPQLSPASDRIAFVSDRTGVPQLWSVALDGSALTRVTAFEDAFPSRPVWSPDGESIAFTRWRGESSDLCTIPASGGTPRCFEDGAGYDLAPIFVADGTALLFGSNRGGDARYRIWRQRLAGGEAEVAVDRGVWPLAEIGGSIYYLDFRKDGLQRRDADGRDVTIVADLPYSLASTVTVDARGIRFARRDGTVVDCTLDGKSCRNLGRLLGLQFRSGLILVGDPPRAIFARHDKPDVEILSLPSIRPRTRNS